MIEQPNRCKREVPDPAGHLHKSRARTAAERAFASGDDEASALMRLVAAHDGVSPEELFHHSRSRAPIAATRQLAMYLMHVALGRSLTQVGTFFGRDRTTVSHACACVEELRESGPFDEEVAGLERRLETACADEAMLRTLAVGGANEA